MDGYPWGVAGCSADLALPPWRLDRPDRAGDHGSGREPIVAVAWTWVQEATAPDGHQPTRNGGSKGPRRRGESGGRGRPSGCLSISVGADHLAAGPRRECLV